MFVYLRKVIVSLVLSSFIVALIHIYCNILYCDGLNLIDLFLFFHVIFKLSFIKTIKTVRKKELVEDLATLFPKSVVYFTFSSVVFIIHMVFVLFNLFHARGPLMFSKGFTNKTLVWTESNNLVSLQLSH